MISGSNCHQVATRKARYGHKSWVVWSDVEGRHADYATPETIKAALLAHGTQDKGWILIERDGSSTVGFWWLGINILRQMRLGY